MDYKDFIESKVKRHIESGFEIDENELNENLFPFQRLIVKKALKAGRYAIFADTGLGKTLMQLSWADEVVKRIGSNVLILTPLAIVKQTLNEASKFGIDAELYDSNLIELPFKQIYVTNYDQLDNIDLSQFSGVVLDESSILKSFDGKTSNKIINLFRDFPYKLACSATPSPNDHTELGMHSEFLGAMSFHEMLAMYFVHDGSETSKWRLRKHAENDFWNYVLSWSIAIDNPKTFGFDSKGYDLPNLNIIEHEIEFKTDGLDLFGEAVVSATELHRDLKKTLTLRINKSLDILIEKPNEQFIIWGLQNAECSLIEKGLENSRNVQGSDKAEVKAKNLIGFANNEFQYLITKTKIASFGMNYQNCNNMIFLSYDFGFEAFYQAVRRCYRFGQTKPVNVHILVPKTQKNVRRVIIEKEKKHKERIHALAVKSYEYQEFKKKVIEMKDVKTENYHLIYGDCVQRIKELETNSIDLSVFSPPFSELYVFSDKQEDMGNSANYQEFEQHFKYLIPELKRVVKDGRIVAVHCMDLPIQKGKEGFIGLRDFSGLLIKMFTGLSDDAIDVILDLQEIKESLEANGKTDTLEYNLIKEKWKKWEEIQLNIGGFIYHARTTIWKNPVTEMQRTKALGLLHKTIKKDSVMSRVGIPDYILFFRNEGENKTPITHQDLDPTKPDYLPVDLWQKYASPVWMDVDYSRTLKYTTARDGNDEKHICPLQLDTIERILHLYSNEGETVLSPFGGIGSEGFKSLKMNRKSVSIELKESYFMVNVENHKKAKDEKSQLTLF